MRLLRVACFPRSPCSLPAGNLERSVEQMNGPSQHPGPSPGQQSDFKRLLIVNRRLSRHIRDLSTMFLSLISAGVRTRLSAPSHTVRITQSQVGETLALKALLRSPSTPVMQPRRIQGLRMMTRPSKVVVTACCSCLGSAACNLAGEGPIQRMRKWQGPFRVACGLRSAHAVAQVVARRADVRLLHLQLL